MVREKVKSFAQGAVGTQRSPGYPCPRFKIIILDEADTMTPEAQSALRRIMEQFAKVTRFCLICNYVTRIIEPLASRCAKFRFRPLSIDSMSERMASIALAEKVSLAPKALDAILRLSQGDMRKAVTYLQSSAQLAAGSEVTEELVVDISGEVPEAIMTQFWRLLCGKSYESLRLFVEELICQSYPVNSLLSLLHDIVVTASSEAMSDVNKALICDKLAGVDGCLVAGASEELQLLDLSGFIMRRIASQGSGCNAAGVSSSFITASVH